MSDRALMFLLELLLTVSALGAAPVVARLARRHVALRQWLGVVSCALGMLLALGACTTRPASGEEPPADAPASSAVDSSDAAKLSVPLDSEAESALPSVVVPPGRPEWVESDSVIENGVYRVAVSSDLHALERDCWRALDAQLVVATRAYIADYLGDARAPLFVNYSAEDIKTRLVDPDNIYHEVVQVSFGPMHQVHALLEFTPEFRSELDAAWKQVQAAGRLVFVGGIALCVLALVTVLYGYFRLDTATRGYYSTRLRFLAVAAILAVIVASVLMARSSDVWIRWLL